MSHYFVKSLSSRFQSIKAIVGLLSLIALMVCAMDSYALGQSGDLLAGTSAQLADTIKGSGKHYIYLAEGLLSLAAYIRTKNMLVLFGIVVVAVFFNIIIKISGL